jgi:hypothetical protein
MRWLGLIALLVGLSAHAEPDLFVDGVALANAVTKPVLANKDEINPLWVSRPARKLLHDLYEGGIFDMQVSRAHEDAMKAWMLEQKDSSITPEALFSKAIEIGSNRVQQGLMIAWAALRDNWQSPVRNDFAHIKKLVDITGEREVFRGNDISVLMKGEPTPAKTIRGDNFSAWYHMSGTALLTYTLAASKVPFPKVLAGAMIELEERIYHDEFIDPFKRRHIDYQGARFGYQLARNLQSFKDKESFERSPRSKQTTVLYQDPDKMPEHWPLREGEKPADYFQRRPRNLCWMSFKQVSARLFLNLPFLGFGGTVTAVGAGFYWLVSR